MENKKYIIYLHKNKINGKCYVGQTSRSPIERWGTKGYGYRHQKYFYSAIEEYGWDNFEHIILEENLLENEVNDREKYWTQYYHALAPEGYSLTKGGSDHFEFSEESLKKRSEESKSRWKNEEYRQKISEKRKEQWQNTEYRKKTLENLNHSGRIPAKSKKVICIETGEIFYSFREAGRQKGMSHNTISKSCETGKAAKGYHWKCVED